MLWEGDVRPFYPESGMQTIESGIFWTALASRKYSGIGCLPESLSNHFITHFVERFTENLPRPFRGVRCLVLATEANGARGLETATLVVGEDMPLVGWILLETEISVLMVVLQS